MIAAELDRLLHRHRARERIRGAREHDHQPIAEVLHLTPIAPDDALAQSIQTGALHDPEALIPEPPQAPP